MNQQVEVVSDRVADEPARFPYRFGVRTRAGGVDVAVHSPHATGVYICFLDPAPGAGWREHRVKLLRAEHGIWTGFVSDIAPGQRYGLRAHGPWDRRAGCVFNASKLLLDPYGRGVEGTFELVPATYPADAEGRPCQQDSAPHVPHSVVLADPEPLAQPRPYTPWSSTVIYEAHIRGLTRQLGSIPPELRGTYAGLAHPETISHLQRLGITAVELLPIHAKVTEAGLLNRGAQNYWGYSTAAFFAPEPSYATDAAQAAGAQAVLDEVRSMVEALHAAQIEVILDVVYNHTCEGGQDGPVLSWRGLDEGGYYLHAEGDATHYLDMTGTGNTLDFGQPRVIQMALDSLRYWVEHVGVDGFRFDLAVTLGRFGSRFDSRHPLLTAMVTDPILQYVKLIAEPWDIGPHGWQTGSFPAPMSEWNDRYRDCVRSFWLSDQAAQHDGATGQDLRELATRLAGSADLFGHDPTPGGRSPVASINFITAHDGFTLADLVSYDTKHNDANGENNRDGTDDNRSWNHGQEGHTDDAGITAARWRSMRNLFGTLILSAGVPMVTAGDEFARSQDGNNNGYCIDDELTWLNWEAADEAADFTATVEFLLALRREHSVLRPARYRDHTTGGRATLSWYDLHGDAMRLDTWHDASSRVLQMTRVDQDDTGCNLLALINGGLESAQVQLPTSEDEQYQLRWDSQWSRPEPAGHEVRAGAEITMDPMSMQVYLSC